MSNYTGNSYANDPNTAWYKIVENISEGSSILDIGCSSGNLGKAIKQEKKGSTVIGVEIDKADAEKAAKALDAVYVVNLESEAIPDGLAKQQFDYIIFSDVIEHLVWPVRTLRKVKSLLKPTGKILFSIPNMAHMSVRLMLLEGRFAYGETGLLDKTHLHFYDEDEIYRVFEEAGYSITNFGWVSYDLPEELIKNRLDKIGLKAGKSFLATRNKIQAAAYQYVGVASLGGKSKRAQRPYVSPDIHEVEEYIEGIRRQLSVSSKEKDAAVKKLKETEEYARGLQAEIKTIKSSRGYKLIEKTRPLRNRLDLNHSDKKQYASNDKLLKNLKPSRHKTAVVVHLYYTESWRMISGKLRAIPKNSFDLFVSLPETNAEFAAIIKTEYGDARVIIVPNRGRDVLPFIYIARRLRRAGYTAVLKLHSKLSTHRTDGREWFGNMLNSLLPKTAKTQKELLRALENPKTGIIGPAGQYTSLQVNFAANGQHMTRVLNKIFGRSRTFDVLQTNRKDYGFFAGTMFWARFDALAEILDQNIKISDFESEKGQIDATLAHALERLFCVVPEIKKRNLYEIDLTGIKKISYKTGDIPDWSNVYIGPKGPEND